MMGAYYDLIVIGGGPAGYTAAAEGAKKGMKAALIERKAIGGTCLNEGCIPTKTLMHCTELYREVKAGEGIGLYAKELSCDMGKLQDYKEGVIGELQKGIGMMLKQNKVTVYEGTGQIVEVPEPGEDSGKIKVQVGDEVLEAGKVLISTGSVPMKLPIPGMDLEACWTAPECCRKGRSEEPFDHRRRSHRCGVCHRLSCPGLQGHHRGGIG